MARDDRERDRGSAPFRAGGQIITTKKIEDASVEAEVVATVYQGKQYAVGVTFMFLVGTTSVTASEPVGVNGEARNTFKFRRTDAESYPIFISVSDPATSTGITVPLGSIKIPAKKRAVQLIRAIAHGDAEFDIYLRRVHGTEFEPGQVATEDFVLDPATNQFEFQVFTWDMNPNCKLAQIRLPRHEAPRTVTFFLPDHPDANKVSVSIPAIIAPKLHPVVTATRSRLGDAWKQGEADFKKLLARRTSANNKETLS